MSVLFTTEDASKQSKVLTDAYKNIVHAVSLAEDIKPKGFLLPEDNKIRNEARRSLREQYNKNRKHLENSTNPTDKYVLSLLSETEKETVKPEKQIGWLETQARSIVQFAQINQITVDTIDKVKSITDPIELKEKNNELNRAVDLVGRYKVENYLQRKAEIESLIKKAGPISTNDRDEYFKQLDELIQSISNNPDFKKAVASYTVLKNNTNLHNLKTQSVKESEEFNALIGAPGKGTMTPATVKIGNDSVQVNGYIGYKLIGTMAQIEERKRSEDPAVIATTTLDPKKLTLDNILGQNLEPFKELIYPFPVKNVGRDVSWAVPKEVVKDEHCGPEKGDNGPAGLKLNIPSQLILEAIQIEADGSHKPLDNGEYALYKFGGTRIGKGRIFEKDKKYDAIRTSLAAELGKELEAFIKDENREFFPIYLVKRDSFGIFEKQGKIAFLEKNKIVEYLGRKDK